MRPNLASVFSSVKMQLPFHSNENTHEGFRTGFDTGQSPERWQLVILWPSTGDTTSILTQSRRSRRCRAYNKHAKLFTGLPWPESCRSFVPRTSRRMQEESHAESRKHLRTSVTVQLKTGFLGPMEPVSLLPQHVLLVRMLRANPRDPQSRSLTQPSVSHLRAGCLG